MSHDATTPEAGPPEAAPPEFVACSEPSAPVDAGSVAGLIEPTLEPPVGLVAVTLVVLALVAMVAVWFAPSARPANSDAAGLAALATGNPWTVEPALLQAIADDDAALLARSSAGGKKVQEAEARLHGAVAAVLAQEVTVGAAGLADLPAARERVGQVEEEVRQLALGHGRDAVQAAALRWAQQVVAALLPVAKAAATTGDWTAALASPAGRDVDALAPGFAAALSSAHVERWVTDSGWQPAAELALQALARQRFLAFAARVPSAQQLPEQVSLLLLRWKAETHDGLGLERRMGLLKQLRARDPTYPAEFEAGRLYWQADRCDAALPLLAEAIATRQRPAESRMLQAACLQRLQAPSLSR